MCIVSIFCKENSDFILTQNRDESILRPTSKIAERKSVGSKWYKGPTDLVSGGTWIYYSEDYTACLLNGGYEKHKHRPPYRKSRGLLMLDLLQYKSIDQFCEEINLQNIEPFTMVMLSRHSQEKTVLVWDEKKKYREDVSKIPLIVRSSIPLYSETEIKNNQLAFMNLKKPSPSTIAKLHFELRMRANSKYPTVQTTSISQVIQRNSKLNLKFCPIISS